MPGTFQHSVQLSNLVAEAAREIGANSQLARAGALYHDIGKMDNPAFFTENQHDVNPHEVLTPEQSAKIVIRHVTDGLKRAEKEKLPMEIRNFILEHHGRNLAKYFYTTACNNNGGNPVDPDPFTYPGPNPRSKETSLLMMADATEAASRSLKEYNDETISNLVNKIIDGQIAQGLMEGVAAELPRCGSGEKGVYLASAHDVPHSHLLSRVEKTCRQACPITPIRLEKCSKPPAIRSEKCNEPPIIRLEKCNESRKRIVAKDFRHTAHSDKWKRLSLTRSKSISYSDRASGHAFLRNPRPRRGKRRQQICTA